MKWRAPGGRDGQIDGRAPALENETSTNAARVSTRQRHSSCIERCETLTDSVCGKDNCTVSMMIRMSLLTLRVAYVTQIRLPSHHRIGDF